MRLPRFLAGRTPMSDAPKARVAGIGYHDEGESVRRLLVKKDGALMSSCHGDVRVLPLVLLQLLAASLLALTACGQARPHGDVTTFDPALVQEQRRRIAAFDS